MIRLTMTITLLLLRRVAKEDVEYSAEYSLMSVSA